METDSEVLVADLFRHRFVQIGEEITPLRLIYALREPADDFPLNCE